MSDDKKTPEESFYANPDQIVITKTMEPPRSIVFFGDGGRRAEIDFGGESITYSGKLSIDESAKKLFEAFHHMLKVEANKDLRQLLWLKHGCNITSLYGDDGEMQCNKCLIDFKRDTPESIKKRFTQLGLDKAKKEIENGGNSLK